MDLKIYLNPSKKVAGFKHIWKKNKESECFNMYIRSHYLEVLCDVLINGYRSSHKDKGTFKIHRAGDWLVRENIAYKNSLVFEVCQNILTRLKRLKSTFWSKISRRSIIPVRYKKK